jgi:hypothetical protein
MSQCIGTLEVIIEASRGGFQIEKTLLTVYATALRLQVRMSENPQLNASVFSRGLI